jgi:hypothetical protein
MSHPILTVFISAFAADGDQYFAADSSRVIHRSGSPPHEGSVGGDTHSRSRNASVQRRTTREWSRSHQVAFATYVAATGSRDW